MDEKEIKKSQRKRKIWKTVFFILGTILVLWFSLVVYNFYRVRTDRKAILCFGNIEDVENDKEYSKTCYGILYKYREYYLKDTDAMTAREYTLFFKEFERKPDEI